MVSDPPFTNFIQGSDRNEHDGFEDHRKEDVISKVSDLSFTNLIQRSDNDKELMLIGLLFGGKIFH